MTSKLAHMYMWSRTVHNQHLYPQLHTLQTTKAGWGLEMWPGYKQAEPSGLAVLQQLHMELNGECS